MDWSPLNAIQCLRWEVTFLAEEVSFILQNSWRQKWTINKKKSFNKRSSCWRFNQLQIGDILRIFLRSTYFPRQLEYKKSEFPLFRQPLMKTNKVSIRSQDFGKRESGRERKNEEVILLSIVPQLHRFFFFWQKH